MLVACTQATRFLTLKERLCRLQGRGKGSSHPVRRFYEGASDLVVSGTATNLHPEEF